MTLRQSKQIVAGYPVANAIDAVAGVCQVSEFLVPSGLAVNDVIEMGAIAEGMIVTDFTLVVEDMDTGAGIVLNAGILSGVYGVVDNARTCGSEFVAASTAGQTGGVARAAAAAGLMLTPNLDVVPYGLKITTGAAGVIVGARIRTFCWMKPAPVGI